MIIQSNFEKAAQAISQLGYCNPFTPKRIELERVALGDAFIFSDSTWHKRQDRLGVPPNLELLTQVSITLADKMRTCILAGESASPQELQCYQQVVHYLLYNSFQPDFHAFLEENDQHSSAPRRKTSFYSAFKAKLDHYLPEVISSRIESIPPEHLFACFFQVRRAFHFIYDNILGSSPLSVQLRASVWESIFTHDMRRYRRGLTQHMTDITTLITGPSGTGKELVAQAIGLARFIPFNPTTHTFQEDYAHSFYPLNLSAFSPTLIESELFGHKKGAFTGALQDRQGWFSLCSALGSVFLDEIGDAELSIQVKLLRVLQTRNFQPVGDVTPHVFHGKVIAATNRDLNKALEQGQFREDLYYRLCADVIQTPSLKDQLEDSPDHLRHLLLHLTQRVVGEHEAASLTDEVESFIKNSLGMEYHWPGNVRELEQCVRNILVRKHYTPQAKKTPPIELRNSILKGEFTADELMTHYVSMIYAQTGNYEETGRILQLDGRTVKSKVEPDLVARYRST